MLAADITATKQSNHTRRSEMWLIVARRVSVLLVAVKREVFCLLQRREHERSQSSRAIELVVELMHAQFCDDPRKLSPRRPLGPLGA